MAKEDTRVQNNSHNVDASHMILSNNTSNGYVRTKKDNQSNENNSDDSFNRNAENFDILDHISPLEEIGNDNKELSKKDKNLEVHQPMLVSASNKPIIYDVVVEYDDDDDEEEDDDDVDEDVDPEEFDSEEYEEPYSATKIIKGETVGASEDFQSEEKNEEICGSTTNSHQSGSSVVDEGEGINPTQKPVRKENYKKNIILLKTSQLHLSLN